MGATHASTTRAGPYKSVGSAKKLAIKEECMSEARKSTRMPKQSKRYEDSDEDEDEEEEEKHDDEEENEDATKEEESPKQPTFSKDSEEEDSEQYTDAEEEEEEEEPQVAQPPAQTPNAPAVIEEETDHHSPPPTAQPTTPHHVAANTPSSNEEQMERIANMVAQRTADEVVKNYTVTMQHQQRMTSPQPAITPVVPKSEEEKDILEEEEIINQDHYNDDGVFITKRVNALRFNIISSSQEMCQYVGMLLLFGLSIYILIALLEVLLLHPNIPPNLTSSDVITTAPPPNRTEEKVEMKDTIESGAPPCFADSVLNVEDDNDELWKSSHVGIDSCISGKELTSCPKHGRCAGGYLRDCLSNISFVPTTVVTNFDSVETLWVEPLYIKNENSDGCMLNPNIVSFTDMVEESIVDLTVEITCSLWSVCASLPSSEVVTTVKMETNEDGDGDGDGDGGETKVQVETNPPLFTLEGLVDYINENYSSHEEDNVEDVGTEGEEEVIDETKAGPKYSVDFLKRILFLFDQDMIQIVEQEDVLLLGLTTEYTQQQMKMPFSCWLKLLVIDMIRSLYILGFSLVGYVVGFLFRSAINFPISTLSTLIVFYGMAWVRNKRRETRETRGLVMRIREIAYERLIECRRGGRGGYAVLFLRDEIGHEMYPCSIKERKKFFARVWPKVVSEVRHDNRVRKAQRVVEGGKKLDHWEWIAPVTGHKKHVVMEGVDLWSNSGVGVDFKDRALKYQ